MDSNDTRGEIQDILNGTTINYSLDFQRTLASNIAGSLFTLMIATISFMGNTAVILVSFWDPILRDQNGNVLIVYLAITDSLTALLVMVPSAVAVAADYWPFGTILCKITTGFNFMFACSSSINICFIAVDRAYAVVFPLVYKTKLTIKVMLSFCGVIFSSSFIIFLLGAVPNWSHYDYTEGNCALKYLGQKELPYVYSTGVSECFIVPAIVVAICNALIIRVAKKASDVTTQPAFIRRNGENGTSLSQSSHTRKTIKSMVFVVCIYYTCFTPYAITKLIKLLLGEDAPPWFNYLTTILIFLASAVNPFVYGILRKDFRNAFKRLPRMLREKLLYLF